MSSKKKRSLPSWMKDPGGRASTSSTLTSPKVDPTLSTQGHSNDDKIDERQDEDLRSFKDMIDGLINEDNSSNNFSQDDSPKINGTNSIDAEDNHDDEETSSSKRSKDNSPKINGASSIDAEDNHNDDEEPSSSKRSKTSFKPNTSGGSDSINDPILVINGMSSPTPPAPRKSCYYGSSCYRKNPQHRADFAHPGDADFSDSGGTATTSQTTGGSPANDTRPLCEYGTACYRKNPQHQRDFRHDAPQKRKARPTDLQDIPSDNDGDFNSSFSSDDYKPGGGSESDDSFVTSDSMGSGESDFDPENEEENEKKDKKKRKKYEQNKKKRAKRD